MSDDHTSLLPPFPSKRGATRGGFGLPRELQEKACRRVSQFALLMTALVTVVFLASRPVWQDFTADCSILIVRVMQGIILLLSLGLFLLARSKRIRPAVILTLGLWYEFLFCLVVSVGYNWFTGTAYGLFAAINLSTLVIAVYPMIVPSPPGKTLFTALACAATAPFSLFVLGVFDQVKTHPADYLGVTLYPALCVVLAVFGSRIIHGLNREVADAREVGSYRLVHKLGQGGMGEVWQARHRLLARPAAVKLIRADVVHDGPATTGELAVQRFEREAQVTASLQSPHTVQLYDFGCTEDGQCFHVMELLDGLDLDSFVERYGPMPPGRVVHVLRQACLSLAEAHDKGLVHRDIKPANILICRYGRDHDFVKVLDFGLVALRPGQESGDHKLTAEGFAGGTPSYLAPEMAEGGQVIPQTDLYALGCVAYWLLTGRPVFEGDSPVAVILAHVREEPRAPSAAAELDIPPELDDLILACLQKDPLKRPADADDLLARLEACPLEEPWTPDLAAKWWKSHRPETPADGEP